jgi:ribosomal protein L44E
MHSRMRHRVAEFLKILNRAKPEAEKERKTARRVSLRRTCAAADAWVQRQDLRAVAFAADGLHCCAQEGEHL